MSDNETELRITLRQRIAELEEENAALYNTIEQLEKDCDGADLLEGRMADLVRLLRDAIEDDDVGGGLTSVTRDKMNDVIRQSDGDSAVDRRDERG